MHCREDIRKALIKKVINANTTERIQPLGNNKLFLRNTDWGTTQGYNVANNLTNKINKLYDSNLAVYEQSSDGHSVIIKPSKELIDEYYNTYIDNYYKNNPDQTDRFGDSTPMESIKKNASFSAAKLSPKGLEKVRSFVRKAGFKIVDIFPYESNLMARSQGGGERSLILGVADFTKQVIEILDGKEDSTLAEEAAHVMVEMLKQANNPLYKQLFNKVGQLKIWDLVRTDPLYFNNPLYQKDGKPDIVKLKDEAIGKLIAEMSAFKEGTGANVEDLTLPSEGETNQTWALLMWNKILDFFKNAFKKPGFNPFEEATDILLGNKEFTPVEINSSNFANITNPNAVQATLKLINVFHNPKVKGFFNNIYLKGNKEIFFNKLMELGAPKQQVEILQNWLQNNDPKTLEEMELGILSEMSYTVEINTAKDKKGLKEQAFLYNNPEMGSPYENFDYNGDKYTTGEELEFDGEYHPFYKKNGKKISRDEFNKAGKNYRESLEETPTQHYSNMTVPGGINYTENEIATPGIVPSIKGHAQFSTENGIGWFRSDDKQGDTNWNSWYAAHKDDYQYFNKSIEEVKDEYQNSLPELLRTKTRRILEVQSDEFQKLYKNFKLGNSQLTAKKLNDGTWEYSVDDHPVSKKDYDNSWDNFLDAYNPFLKLLHTDNNWVRFFIQSIVQDSAKKGYEKVLFPTGDTASKVEGHETLEDFYRDKKNRIAKLEEERDNINSYGVKETKLGYILEDAEGYTPMAKYKLGGSYKTKSEARDAMEKAKYPYEVEIKQLQEELKRVESEGFAALKPIWNFYETTVGNTLKKVYKNVERIKDEYGSEWYQVGIEPIRDQSTIFFKLGVDTQESVVNKINEVDAKIVEENGHFKINGELVKHSFNADKGRTEDAKMEELVELGRIDIKNILNRYIDKDGKLRDEPLDKTEPIHIVQPGANKYTVPYDIMFSNIGQQLKSFPKDTIFLPNKVIYNPKRDVATKVDLIAISPEGTTNVRTFEFIRDVSSKTDPNKLTSKNQRERIQEYLTRVKYTLQDGYGVTNFGQSRGIPIIIKLNNNKGKRTFRQLMMGKVDSKTEKFQSLFPIPSIDEKTGNKEIDKHIQQLNALYKSINESPVVEGRRDVKVSQLNAIFKAIQHLQINQNFTPLFQNVATLLENTKTLVQKHNERFVGKPITDFTDKEINEEAVRLLNLADSINLYKELDLQFKDYFAQDKEANKEYIEKSKELASGVREEIRDIKNLINDFASRFISEKRGIRDLISPEPVISGFNKNFRELSEAQTQAEKTLYLLTEEYRNKTELETLDRIEKLIQIEKELKETGLKTHEYQKLIEKYVNGKRTNTLIDKYSHEFYTTLKEKIEAKDVKWIKANINLDEFAELVTEYRERQLAQLEDMVFLGDAKTKAQQKKKLKSDIERNTNLKTDYPYLNYIFAKQFPIDKWISKEYTTLKENPAAFKLYEYITDINKLAKRSGYLTAQQYRTFLPFMRKGLTEKLVFGGSYNALDNLISSISINDEMVGYGNFNSLTGEIEDVIPKYFINDIGKDKEVNGEIIRDYSNISDDIFKNMAIYTKQVVEYGHKKNVEGLTNMLYFVEKNKQSLQVNQFGNLIKDALNFPSESNEENSKHFRNYLKNTLYNQKYITGPSTDVSLGKSKKTNSIFSLGKTIDLANRFVTLKVLGVNPASSFAQLMGGTFQAWINANKFYTIKELEKAKISLIKHTFIKDDEKLTIALMKNFLPLGNEELQRKINKMSLSTWTKGSGSEILMYMMRAADSVIQYSNFLAMMDNAIVINGELQNVRNYYRNTDEYQKRYSSGVTQKERKEIEHNFEDKIEELKEKYGIAKFSSIVDGKLKIQATEESIHKYRSLTQKIGRQAAGNVAESGKNQFKMNVITNSMLMFKNWIPNLVFQRTQGLTHIIGTDSYEWGRMRMVGKLLLREGLHSLKVLHSMVIANDKGVDKMRELFKEKQISFFEKHNKQLEMTEAEFFDLVRQNIHSQVKDTILFLLLIAMFYSFKALAPDDDEDDSTKSAYSYFMRTIDNVSNEMTFYYNPMSLSNILGGSLFPSLSILTDATKILKQSGSELLGLVFQDDEMQDDAKPLKYIMKSFPMSKEALNYIAIFFPELADEMGVQIKSKAKQH